jgi:hypothetical protein
MKTFYRIEKSSETISAFHGEAGYGIYATPNQNVLEYYKSKTNEPFRVLKFKPLPRAVILNLDKLKKELINFIKSEVEIIASKDPFYQKPKITMENYHRFPWAITKFIQIFGCSAYIIQHKHPSLPTGKQIIITRIEHFDVSEI